MAALRLPRLIRRQDGFTLLEALIAAALSTIVFSAVLSALDASQHAESRDQEWGLVLQEGRTGLALMTREMRQAYSIRSDSHDAIDFYATIGGKSYEISYNCLEKESGTEYNRCVRRAAQFKAGKAPSAEEVAAAKGEAVIKYVLNGTAAEKSEVVFKEYTPNQIAPDLVTVKVILPASGTLKLADAAGYKHHIVLENGAYIRDMALGV
ncbi:MAG: prepilin-type N-terminal cleavage/methylation domain-containing protein [Solirubrobacteraceae bacterium]